MTKKRENNPTKILEVIRSMELKSETIISNNIKIRESKPGSKNDHALRKEILVEEEGTTTLNLKMM